MNLNLFIEKLYQVYYYDLDLVHQQVKFIVFQSIKKRVLFILDISVVREATAALQSVFPQTELGSFLSLSKRDKDRQLVELTQIVTGIRLFNKECGKGGEGIDNLPGKNN